MSIACKALSPVPATESKAPLKDSRYLQNSPEVIVRFFRHFPLEEIVTNIRNITQEIAEPD